MGIHARATTDRHTHTHSHGWVKIELLHTVIDSYSATIKSIHTNLWNTSCAAMVWLVMENAKSALQSSRGR